MMTVSSVDMILWCVADGGCECFRDSWFGVIWIVVAWEFCEFQSD